MCVCVCVCVCVSVRTRACACVCVFVLSHVCEKIWSATLYRRTLFAEQFNSSCTPDPHVTYHVYDITPHVTSSAGSCRRRYSYRLLVPALCTGPPARATVPIFHDSGPYGLVLCNSSFGQQDRPVSHKEQQAWPPPLLNQGPIWWIGGGCGWGGDRREAGMWGGRGWVGEGEGGSLSKTDHLQSLRVQVFSLAALS